MQQQIKDVMERRIRVKGPYPAIEVVWGVEAFEEFLQTLVFIPFPAEELRVFLHVVDAPKVFDSNRPIAHFIKLLERLNDKTASMI